MTFTAALVRRTYYALSLGNTLAASLIWGVNTILLLDAGLDNFEAFAAVREDIYAIADRIRVCGTST